MNRRVFMTVLGGATLAWPLAAHAQQGERMRRIGIMMNAAANDPHPEAHVAAFRRAMHQLGWAEGRNVQIDVRWAGGSAEAYRRYAPELVAMAALSERLVAPTMAGGEHTRIADFPLCVRGHTSASRRIVL
jgi:hypothetical protein